MNREIPATLNVFLCVFVVSALIALLWLASSVSWQGAIAIGVLFALLTQTNYALLHEGTHDILHPNPALNRLLGRMCAAMFPTSFTLMRHAHVVHHCCNRTDHEMFDYYYPDDKLFFKRVQWYAIVTGAYWPLIPIGNLLLAFSPALLRDRFWQRFRSTDVLFIELADRDLKQIRLEVIGSILLFAAMFAVLEIHWLQTLILYGMGGFLWSTRQYVTHAFSKRHVVDGAYNLKTSWLMDKFLLHGGWDLVHHQNPHLSWKYLPETGPESEPRIPFWPQYFSLWRGPRPCGESAPDPLASTRYSTLGHRPD